MAKKIDLDGLEFFKGKENAMVTDEYSSSKTYALGDYAYHAGTLYKCTTAITTAEAWTAGHWTAAKLADDLTSQSEKIDDLELGFTAIPWSIDGTGYVKYADGTTASSSVQSHTDYVDISNYSEIKYKRVWNDGSNPSGGIAFYDSSKTFISGIQNAKSNPTSGSYENTLYSANVPDTAYYARFSTLTDTSRFGTFALYGKLSANKNRDNWFTSYGKTEVGSLQDTYGNLTNSDIYTNTRSEMMYEVATGSIVKVIFTRIQQSGIAEVKIYFYATDTSFLSYSTFSNVNIVEFTMPTNAVYFKIRVRSTTTVRRTEDFTVKANTAIKEVYNANIINVTVGESLAFCYEVNPTALTSGRLLLPPNYSVSGEKVPLIVFVHGSGGMLEYSSKLGTVTTSGTTITYLPYLQYLADEGFAVFDCYPWTKQKTLSGTPYNPICVAPNIASYLRGIEYSCSRFNIDITKVSLLCKSQGGQIGQWAIMQEQFPFKTVSLFAPACGIGLTHLFYGQYVRNALTKYISFNGTSDEITEFINSGEISDTDVASFISKNKATLLSMAPMTQGITNGDLDTLLNGVTSGQSTVPQWMLDLGLPTKPEGAIDIYTLSEHDEYVKNGAIPSKFWVAFDDDQVSGYSVYATYYWLCNGGSDTAIRIMPTGTGGHHSMDTDANALKSSGTTALGISYSNIPTAYVEVVDFIRSKFGD